MSIKVSSSWDNNLEVDIYIYRYIHIYKRSLEDKDGVAEGLCGDFDEDQDNEPSSADKGV